MFRKREPSPIDINLQVRLSFPVKIAVEKVRKIVRNAVILAYHHAAEEIEELELECNS